MEVGCGDRGISYFKALATDYDGTIAHDGDVDDGTLEVLERLKRSGRRLIMVTGRESLDLRRAFPRLDLFDRVVAENGALLFTPATNQKGISTVRPSPALKSVR